MQDTPSRLELLGGLSRFLGDQVAPALNDRGLAYRLRVGIYILDTVVRELASEEEHDAAELEGLRALMELDNSSDPAGEARHRLIRSLNEKLAQSIRDGDFADSKALHDHVKATLTDKLGVVQPNFDVGFDCETKGARIN